MDRAKVKMRILQVVLVVSLIGFSWLGMQMVHEGGHVIAARLTGGTVVKVVVHPLAISRTDLGDNPRPLVVVWGGPLVGAVLPLGAFALAVGLQVWWGYLVRFFAGFCLVANGVYIGAGWLVEGGDPAVMMRNGTAVWVMVVFGILTVPLGLYLWHGQGRHFGFGAAKGKVDWRAVFLAGMLFGAIVGGELIWGML